MFPAPVEYRAADSVAAAVELLAGREDATPIAGGQGLVPDLKRRAATPGLLVDVSGLDGLRGVTAGDPAGVRVGALTTLTDLAAAPAVRQRVPALADAADRAADRQVSNRATLGGNVVEAAPGADPPAAVLAAGADLRLRGPAGRRSVGAGDFFAPDGPAAPAGDEVLTELRFPDPGGERDEGDGGGEDGDDADGGGDDAPARAGAYVRRTHPTSGYAAVGVAVSLASSDGTLSRVRVAATGAVDRPRRLRAAEDALRGTAGDPAALDRAGDRAGAALDGDALRGDREAPAAHRLSLLGAHVERAARTALERAGHV